jgi:NagD protein
MMRTARKELGMATSESIMIGDTMETDILGGVQMGYRTILVLTGSTRQEDLAKYAFKPDLIVDSVADLCAMDSAPGEILPPANHEDDTPLDMSGVDQGSLLSAKSTFSIDEPLSGPRKTSRLLH